MASAGDRCCLPLASEGAAALKGREAASELSAQTESEGISGGITQAKPQGQAAVGGSENEQRVD